MIAGFLWGFAEVLSVCAVFLLVAHHPQGYRAFLIAQPGITEALAHQVESAARASGLPVTPLLVLGGIPLKLYAFAAFAAGTSLVTVLAWTLFARLARILPIYLLFVLIGKASKKWIAVHPRAALGLFAGAWTLFYAFYFARMGW